MVTHYLQGYHFHLPSELDEFNPLNLTQKLINDVEKNVTQNKTTESNLN